MGRESVIEQYKNRVEQYLRLACTVELFQSSLIVAFLPMFIYMSTVAFKNI
jgi:hypothetical protein